VDGAFLDSIWGNITPHPLCPRTADLHHGRGPIKEIESKVKRGGKGVP